MFPKPFVDYTQPSLLHVFEIWLLTIRVVLQLTRGRATTAGVSPEPIRLWSRYSSLRLVTDRTEARYARRAAVAHAAGRKNNQAAADQTEPYSTNIPF